MNDDVRKHIQYGDIGKMNAAMRQLEQHEATRAGKTKVRPATSVRNSLLKVTSPFDKITYIDADNPSTNYFSGTDYYSSSDTTSSFGNKKKILLKLADEQEPILARSFMAIFNGIKSFTATATFTSAGVSVLEANASLLVRMVPIITDFEPETITWNDYAGLTLGSYYSTQFIVSNTVEISGALNPTSQTIEKTYAVTYGVNDEPSIALHGAIGAGTVMYGLALEVCANFAGTPASQLTTLRINEGTNPNPTIFEGYSHGIVLSHNSEYEF